MWVWLGDIVYADIRVGAGEFLPAPLSVVRHTYSSQKNLTAYQRLRANVPIFGVWDDHDYGVDEGDGSLADKDERKDILLEFLDVPHDAAVRQHRGIYQAHTFGDVGRRVKLILLDNRYFKQVPESYYGFYTPRSSEKSLLGEEQWDWLESQLSDSDAQLHIIGSGTQIVPTDKPMSEKWGNFPSERLRLLRLVRDSGVPTVLLSGDVHMAELTATHLDGTPFYELTSSGMTHSWSGQVVAAELVAQHILPASYRLAPIYSGFNFGLVTIDWEAKPAAVWLEAYDRHGQPQVQHVVTFPELLAASDLIRSTVPPATGQEWRQLMFILTAGALVTSVVVAVAFAVRSVVRSVRRMLSS
eukprot:PLAT4369.4.p1 GENE.PLAT4369.4~~PLAT4369.4.p1  ORF type:complete len:413 (+),score=76.27 PLAT4369.4:169-1239(+)